VKTNIFAGLNEEKGKSLFMSMLFQNACDER
jgi:hypothetical protein